MNKITFKDSIILPQLVSDSLRTDASTILERGKKPSLRVQIDATNSGVIINRRVYPGKHVKAGYKSFYSKDNGGMAEYDKPILKHHDMYSDPIGRIVNATYTQLKQGYSFENDFLIPDQNGAKGSGFVTVTAIISDEESIAKILDARYVSVSAGHRSEYLLCSTCGDSIFECEHFPGEKYNAEGERSDAGTECYSITGPMTYDELSFVNLPASPPAKIVNYEWQDCKNNDWDLQKHITTQVTAKRDAVRDLCLCDEDGELSLLSGKNTSSTKKTVIVVSPTVADKLKHIMSSDTSKKADESSNDRQPENGKDPEVLNVEQNLDKANKLDSKSNEDMKMDEELKKLQSELQSLKDELATAKTQVTELQKQVEAKDSHIGRLTADAQENQGKMSKTLAMSLASMKSRFGKTLPKGEDGVQLTVEQYVDKLAERSVESLQDSLSDFMLEIDQLPVDKPEPKAKPANDIVGGDKVTDPTPKDKGNAPKGKSSVQPSTRAVDRFSQGLLDN